MPDDIVRLNSVVTIKDSYNNIRAFEIVKPDKSDLKANKISILTPMGLALFGYAKNDEIMWRFPLGMQAIRIINVEQNTILKKILS